MGVCAFGGGNPLTLLLAKSISQNDKTLTISDEGLLFWWAHQDLNLGPKDSGLCSFHYSLDYAFIILIAQLRWVPSSLYTFKVFLLSFARR